MARQAICKMILVGVMGLALAGCFHAKDRIRTVVETQTVEVPVAVKPEIPVELEQPLKVTPPKFVSPRNEKAVVGLTKEGVQDFQEMTFKLNLRVREWESFWDSIDLDKDPHP